MGLPENVEFFVSTYKSTTKRVTGTFSVVGYTTGRAALLDASLGAQYNMTSEALLKIARTLPEGFSLDDVLADMRRHRVALMAEYVRTTRGALDGTSDAGLDQVVEMIKAEGRKSQF